MNAQQLQNLKNAIETKKQEMSRLQGAKESAEEALKELGFSSVKEAEEFLDSLEDEIAELETKTQNTYEGIAKQFPHLI